MSLALEGTLDTNILLRFLLQDNAAQYLSARKVVEAPRNLRISLLSLAEIVFILEGLELTRDEIRENIEKLASYRHLHMPRGIVVPALALWVAHPALSFVDCFLSIEAEAEHAQPLWTFDKKLAKQASAAKLVA